MTSPLVKSTTDDLIEELEAAAKEATPGEREWIEDRFNGGWSGLYANDEPVIVPQSRNEGDTGAAWFASEDDADECGLSDADRELIRLCTPENVQTLIARIRELEEAQRWIPCSERLPDANGEVWCYGLHRQVDGPESFVGYFDAGKWFAVNNGDYIDGGYGNDYAANVTHWKPVTPP